MRDVFPILDLLDLAIAESEGLATEEIRERAAEAAAAARGRRAFFSSSVVAAIVGGTGSGKSSLLNAIAGDRIASTSALRPHTDEPLAWVPAQEDAIASMLSERGIDEIIQHDDGSPVTLVDLPDLDSIDDRHREIVERVLPLVDAVIWVFDPVKYHDPSIHDDFLSELTDYEDVFVFVINKADRLDEGEVEAIVAHLTGLLEIDGFDDPTVHAIAAAPPSGDSIGIDELSRTLEDRLIRKRADRTKLVEDLLHAGRSLATEVGVWDGTPDDAHDRIRTAAGDREALTAELEEMGIAGPIAEGLLAAEDDVAVIDEILRKRAMLAATVAALGVACVEIKAYEREGTP